MIERVREVIRKHVYLAVSLLTILLVIIFGGVAVACGGFGLTHPHSPRPRPPHIVKVPPAQQEDPAVLGDSYTPPSEPGEPEEPPFYPVPTPAPTPVPIPRPIEPLPPTPVPIEPPIIIDPPFIPPTPCGGCGYQATTKDKQIVCPMTTQQVNVMVCRLDV